MRKKKGSICTAVSFDGSSVSGLKIVQVLTDGSAVTTTVMASISRAGISYIRSHGLNRMLETSGARAIMDQMENGNDATK